MKKGRSVMLIICALAVTMVMGVFMGRNMNTRYASLPLSNTEIMESTSDMIADYRLDINTATKVQLMELPGIGEQIAERIIDYRLQNGNFSSTDELMNVEGIGEKKLLQIEALIRAGG